MTGKEFKDLEKEFCDYETSVALKELGFREKCPTYYDTEDNVGLLYNTQWALDNTPYQFTDCLESHNAYEGNSYVDAPTMWETQKWLREEIDIIVYPEKNSFGWYCAIHNNIGKVHQFKYSEEYNTYEEALLEGIKEAVKILKEENND